jgi:hypothetical protein
MAAVIERGIVRGEVREDVRIDIARELGQAVLWHRFLVTGEPITPDLVEHIVDHVLIPYATSGPPPPGPANRDGRGELGGRGSA